MAVRDRRPALGLGLGRGREAAPEPGTDGRGEARERVVGVAGCVGGGVAGWVGGGVAGWVGGGVAGWVAVHGAVCGVGGQGRGRARRATGSGRGSHGTDSIGRATRIDQVFYSRSPLLVMPHPAG